MNDALEPDDGKEPGAEAGEAGERQHQEYDETFRPNRIQQDRGAGHSLHVYTSLRLLGKKKLKEEEVK